ncbi:MAG: MqnA/MqnD/SBP family protein [Clostridia bacterium]
MKKIIAMLLCAIMMLSLAACATQTPAAEALNVSGLKGPTGMGMVALMGEEYSAQYKVTMASAPDDITGAFISGETDIAAVPINLAAVLYNKLEGDVVLLAVNTLGVLYVLENGNEINTVADLAGKTLYATGQGATPEYVINYLLEKNGVAGNVDIQYKAEHSELATLLASGEVALGMLPEPNVTASLAKNDKLRVALDLTAEWEKVSDAALVQGCLIAKRSFVEANKAAIDQFMKDYKASTAFVNEHHEKASMLMETYGILPNAALAKAAIKKCNIVCITGEEAQKAADGMLKVLFDANPKSVGGTLPGEDMYVG